MRIVFFGTPALAVPPLAAITERHEVCSVVCQPDRPQGRGRKPAPPPVKSWAEEHGIPVHQPAKLNDGAFEEWLRAQQPELCALAAYGRLLKQPILDVPRHGFLNLHPSLLPKYRGPSPIQAAILNGDAVTGVTIMRISLEMDAGDILLQEEAPIAEDDTTATLTERLAHQGAALFVEALDLIAMGKAQFRPQPSEGVSHCRMLSKADGNIRWEEPAEHIHNLVRAAIPWPVAYSVLNGVTLRIHKTKVVDTPAQGSPGTITAIGKDDIHVATGEGTLAVLHVQPPGKRPMTVGEYLRGRQVAVGDRFQGA